MVTPARNGLATLDALPRLGLGISSEFDSAVKGIDAVSMRQEQPGLIDFLEYGGDLERGLDEHVLRWAAHGWPTTYHFLDVNLEEAEDLGDDWLTETATLARQIGAAWLCGDAGQWHFGPRDRGQQILLPPILTAASADEMAACIERVQAATGYVVLPENPPSTVYLGELHLLDYYARVSARSNCGLLIDAAHLAIYQRMKGHAPTTGLDAFPCDRIVELHVAGGVPREHEGFSWVDDNHAPDPLPDTWEIVDYLVARASRLRAIVYECERNTTIEVLDHFRTLRPMIAPPSKQQESRLLPSQESLNRQEPN